jgi:hypothetical protein
VRSVLGDVSSGSLRPEGLRCPLHHAGCPQFLQIEGIQRLFGESLRALLVDSVVSLSVEDADRLVSYFVKRVLIVALPSDVCILGRVYMSSTK